MTAKSCCARLLDARDGERYFLHFFHVTVFTQPRSISDIEADLVFLQASNLDSPDGAKYRGTINPVRNGEPNGSRGKVLLCIAVNRLLDGSTLIK
jgi:hypothetical protein